MATRKTRCLKQVDPGNCKEILAEQASVDQNPRGSKTCTPRGIEGRSGLGQKIADDRPWSQHHSFVCNICEPVALYSSGSRVRVLPYCSRAHNTCSTSEDSFVACTCRQRHSATTAFFGPLARLRQNHEALSGARLFGFGGVRIPGAKEHEVFNATLEGCSLPLSLGQKKVSSDKVL